MEGVSEFIYTAGMSGWAIIGVIAVLCIIFGLHDWWDDRF